MTATATDSGSRSLIARRAGGVRTSSYSPSHAGSPAEAKHLLDPAYDVSTARGQLPIRRSFRERASSRARPGSGAPISFADAR